jgi:hypothetical protein
MVGDSSDDDGKAGELVVGDGRVGILVGFSLRETPGLDVPRRQ